MAFPIFEIPPCSSLCSVANFETVSFTFLDDWFRRCNCKGETSSSLLAVNTNDTLGQFSDDTSLFKLNNFYMDTGYIYKKRIT